MMLAAMLATVHPTHLKIVTSGWDIVFALVVVLAVLLLMRFLPNIPWFEGVIVFGVALLVFALLVRI